MITGPERWTYGVEHEFADWNRNEPLPENFGIDYRDVTIVNSNGIAVDPLAKLYHRGGEIQTPPTPTAREQVALMIHLADIHDVTVNYRSNLHVHIRVPGLKDNLEALKQLQEFNAQHLPNVLPAIEPMWSIDDHERRMCKEDKVYPTTVWRKGAKRRLNRCRVSHHTIIPWARVKNQLAAKSLQEFFEAEVPRSQAGRPLWHCQPRAAVNLRQLMQTDTIEFRHWPGTLFMHQLYDAVRWCSEYLLMGLFNCKEDPMKLLKWDEWTFPQWNVYCHWMEVRYRATCHDGTNCPETIVNNIKAIESGMWDDLSGMPR